MPGIVAHLPLQRQAGGFETFAGLAGQDDVDAGRAEFGVVERQPRVGNLEQLRPYPVADGADARVAVVPSGSTSPFLW